jgi:tRNA(fMet)-specific endonuclease VapC
MAHANRIEENLLLIGEFVADAPVLSCDAPTAMEYSLIKDELRGKGRPIPENDIWIAATARQYDLTLITRDDHFGAVDELKRETW